MRHYINEETKLHGNGVKIVRKVHIKGGKGHKSVSHYKRGKHLFTAKKALKRGEVTFIKIGKFIPGLFNDCGCGKKNKNKTKKNKVKK
jgi:hypothetical protein